MKITFFGIHPDDIELGCGGTVAFASSQGHTVTLVDLSPGDSSSNGTTAERAREAEEAAMILGVSKRINLGIPDTKIVSEDSVQASKVVECIRSLQPELIFIPNKFDPHPDHASGGELIERALYLAGVQGYETDHEAWRIKTALVYIGRLDFEPAFILDVTETHEQKIKAIRAHRSQFIFEKGRKRTVLNSQDFLPFIESRSHVFGGKIGVRHGEPFKLTSPLGLHDLSIFKGD